MITVMRADSKTETGISMAHRRNSRIALLAFGTALLVGCQADESVDTSDVLGASNDQETIEEESLELRGGVISTNQLIVQLRIPNGPGGGDYWCSGTIINPRTILTSGYCLAGFAPSGQATTLQVDALRVLPNGTPRCLVGTQAATNVNGIYQCPTAAFTAVIHPNYRPGVSADGQPLGSEHNIAVLKRTQSFTDFSRWISPKLYLGTFDVTPTNSDGQKRLEVHAFGPTNSTPTSRGASGGRVRSGTLELEWYGPRHFLMIGRGAQTCRGDSGGAVTWPGQPSFVVGIVGADSLVPNAGPVAYYCVGGEDYKIRSVRLSGHMDFIRQHAGDPCAEYQDPQGRRVAWCDSANRPVEPPPG